jgi:hypothetical protein
MSLDPVRAALTPGAVRAIAATVRDPVTFARLYLRQDLWGMQERIMRAVAAHPLVAVRACHASSKTHTAAAIVVWWVTRYPDGRVWTTAPTWTQVRRLLWVEVHQALRQGRILPASLLQTELRAGPANYAVGLSTNEGVRFQGLHGGHVLIVLDEAPGVLPGIWQAIAGARAGGDVHVLALGNPTVPAGPFYEAFTHPRSPWRTLTISAFDTPNLAGLTLDDLLALDDAGLDANPRPYLVTRRWVREMYQLTGGDGHPEWDARVRGEFPSLGGHAAFPLAWLRRAADPADPDPAAPVVAGVDVAGPGDDETALCLRQGGCILAVQAWRDPDARGPVAAALAPYRGRLAAVHVDAAGLGWYFAQHLRDLGFPVEPFLAGAAASAPERFANRKAEVYWGFREALELDGLRGLADEIAQRQLAAITYTTTPRGQIAIEEKSAYRQRYNASPDRAEAVILACLPPARARRAVPPIGAPRRSVWRDAP